MEERLLQATKNKEIFLTYSLMGLKKGNSFIDEYVKNFTIARNNLVAIGKPINDITKCFHLARELNLNIKISG